MKTNKNYNQTILSMLLINNFNEGVRVKGITNVYFLAGALAAGSVKSIGIKSHGSLSNSSAVSGEMTRGGIPDGKGNGVFRAKYNIYVFVERDQTIRPFLLY